MNADKRRWEKTGSELSAFIGVHLCSKIFEFGCSYAALGASSSSSVRQ